MFRDTKAFSGFSADDSGRAKEFYAGALGLAWFRDPAGNIISVLEEQ
jgi:hypothetical protein